MINSWLRQTYIVYLEAVYGLDCSVLRWRKAAKLQFQSEVHGPGKITPYCTHKSCWMINAAANQTSNNKWFMQKKSNCITVAQWLAHILYTTLSHLDRKGRYVTLLFIAYSSAFNTLFPPRLIISLKDLQFNTWQWSGFLLGGPQMVSVPSSLTLAPQGSVLRPMLYYL